MAHKEFKFDDEARKELLEGINTVSKAVVSTLGPSGKLVLIRRPDGGTISTKDGITVARNSIGLKSRFADMGARMLRGAGERSVQESGDGTTCTTLLLSSMVNEGFKLVSAGHNPVHLKNGIDYGVKLVIDELNKKSVAVTSPEKIEQVAIISSNGDKEIGKMLRKAYEEVGNSGIITVEKSKNTETKLEMVSGYMFDRGYLNPHFITNEKLEAVLQDARILITDISINNVNVIVPVAEACNKAYPGKPLLIIAPDVVGDALSTLVLNHVNRRFQSCCVRSPGYGDRRAEMLEDMAKLTGATVISESMGMRLEQFDPSWLGGAEKVIVTAGSTTIVNGLGSEEELNQRIAQIRAQIQTTTEDYDRRRQEERLAKLVGGVAVIYVGGYSDAEIDEKLYRWEDAQGATKAAVEGGIIPGAGVSLLRIARGIDTSNVSPELRYGLEIVKRVIQEPAKRIITNAGKEASEVLIDVVNNTNPNFGYNSRDNKYEDLMESGVIDPTKVIRCALQNAASIATLILTTDCLISDVDDEKDSKNEQKR